MNWRLRKLRPAFWQVLLGLGALLTAALIAIAWQAVMRDHRERFAAEAGSVHDQVQQRIQVIDEAISNLATLVNSVTHIDADQFRIFSEDVLQRHRFLQSTAYLPLVNGDERGEFETSRRQAGFPTFVIAERNAGDYRPASLRNRYFPVLFLEPFEPASASLIGFDMLSDPALAAAMQAAIDTGDASPAPSASAPERSYWLFKAIYAGKQVPAQAEARRRAVNGLMALRVNAEALLDEALGTRQLAVNLRFEPAGGHAGAALLDYRHGHEDDVAWALATLNLSERLEIGGHRLELSAHRHLHWHDINYLLLGLALLVGVLVTVLVVLAARRHSRRARELQRHNIEIERQVAEKTAELALEKERAQVTLASIGDAVITTDAGRRVEYLNPVAELLTGWTLAEARGRALEEVFRLASEAETQVGADEHALATETRGLVGDVLVSRDRGEIAIDRSEAPIRNHAGEIIGSVLVFHDVSQQRRLTQEMSYQASHDALTGLVNRRAFEQRLEELLAGAKLNGEQHALLYLDLDQFKIVNDACGHAAGDQLLRQLSVLLARDVRMADLVARLGGDEFGVLLQQCGLERGREIAHKLLQTVNDFRFIWQGRVFTIGASIGLVAINRESESVASILAAADAVCYVAKDKGRNRMQVYEPGDAELAERRVQMQWVTRLKRALERDQFLLYRQPILSLVADAPAPQQEVLLRMRTDDDELIPPGAFLPAAARYGLMPDIDRWVVRHTLHWLARHPDEAGAAVHYNINLSGQSLNDPEFLRFVLQEFEASGVSPARICFEITETAAIATLDNTQRFMQALKERGCRFLLDDFGSGWSSFVYLKNLPVDFIKIDGSFVRDMTDDPLDETMVQAVNDIGHVMGIRTIAEFAETPGILARLRSIGVDLAQGYALGRPRPIDEPLAPPPGTGTPRVTGDVTLH